MVNLSDVDSKPSSEPYELTYFEIVAVYLQLAIMLFIAAGPASEAIIGCRDSHCPWPMERRYIALQPDNT